MSIDNNSDDIAISHRPIGVLEYLAHVPGCDTPISAGFLFATSTEVAVRVVGAVRLVYDDAGAE
jgi:hypothetical protein